MFKCWLQRPGCHVYNLRFSFSKRFYQAATRSNVKMSALYIHWPFCKKICPYCDFNKYVRHNVDHNGMKECLVKEFQSLASMYDINHISSIYFGGGTPSLAIPSTIADILQSVKRQCTLDNDIEITLEVNPTSSEVEQLVDFKIAGVNRVSIGIQALNDEDLRNLGREHSVADGLRCLDQASRVFESRVSVDFMFARPGQTIEQWRRELEMLSSLSCNHVSIYQLTMKRGTPMEKSFRAGQLILPKEDDVAQMYADTIQVLEKSSLHQYEVSNFAKPGFESKHNASYWNCVDYMGLGPGAHGRLTDGESGRKYALVNLPVPEHWLNQVHKRGHGVKVAKPLSQQERIDEFIMLGLRKKEGLADEIFTDMVGFSLLELKNETRIDVLLKENLVVLSEHPRNLHVTDKAMSILDTIVTEISATTETIIRRRHLH